MPFFPPSSLSRVAIDFKNSSRAFEFRQTLLSLFYFDYRDGQRDCQKKGSFKYGIKKLMGHR
jgi:hypothetical protein